jgi:two-component system sensor kinase FixL
LRVRAWVEGGVIRISVRDRGCGAPVGREEKLFEAFFTTKAEGLGMGLAISRSIVESHGGKLWAENHAEAGMTFHFTLPTTAGEAGHGG